MWSVLMYRVLGRVFETEKSMVRDWVKLPEPSTTQTQPSFVGEVPAELVNEGGLDAWDGEDVGGCADEGEPQAPKVDWQPVPQ